MRLSRAMRGERDMTLDIVSYGRRGPSGEIRLGTPQVDQIKRTVRRTPEVMVKVSGGGRDSGTVGAHLKYIGRHGRLPVCTDEGMEIQGQSAIQELLEDWALDLCASQYRPKPAPVGKDTRPKLVHNIVMSMPAGTPHEKVLAAAKVFARENFALQHRYAMVLHTDQAHPHVHLVVKCEHEFEPEKRLYIRKATLRQWREQFAELMREQGVAANATPRQVRGVVRRPYRDPIHHRLRAMRAFAELGTEARCGRNEPKPSTFIRKKVMDMIQQMRTGVAVPDAGKTRVQETRNAVLEDWQATAQALRRQGDHELSGQVERFVQQMAPAKTDAQQLAERWAAQTKPVEKPARAQPRAERSR
ncbi:MAG: relaxase [Comamonadaceae bacterium]|nr:MAG: relaxase [Comamonadaceae bacterium]